MTPPAWGIAALMVVGLAVITLGALWDRRRLRLEAARLRLPPDGAIPGLRTTDAPAYITEEDLDSLAASGIAAATTGSSDRIADLIVLRDGTPSLPAGAPDSRFLTDPTHGLAVLEDPSVLVTDADVSSQRDVLTVLGAALRRGRPLVWVARSFDPDALGSLRANTVTGRITVLPVTARETDLLSRAVAYAGGRLLDASDLAADWFPEDAWGACDVWLADLDQSWVIGRTPPPEKLTPGSQPSLKTS